jgi:hypothetical protein
MVVVAQVVVAQIVVNDGTINFASRFNIHAPSVRTRSRPLARNTDTL